MWFTVFICTFTMLPILLAFVSYMVWIATSTLNKQQMYSQIFRSLAFFNVLQLPMTMLPMMLSQFATGMASARRVGEFLKQPDLDHSFLLAKPGRPEHVVEVNGSFRFGKGTQKDAAPQANGAAASQPDTKSAEDGETGMAAAAVASATDLTPSPPKASAEVLHGIEFGARQGQLVAVIGPVGSGKSSLLAAVLGEIDPSNAESKVYRPESLSYACQKAFIQTMTIRDNILMNHPYDEARYNRVLDVCELRPDLAIFPASDLTEIGDRGVNLSGGQKQRVAIARAAYASHDLLLFDDPLSAVDAAVGEKIFENCISAFCAGKTRILVTNQLQYLPRVDHIVVMDHGRIAEQGTYDPLLAKAGAFKALMEMHIGELGGSHAHEKPAEATSAPTEQRAPILEKQGSEKSAALVAGKTITVEELNSGESKANFWVHYRYIGSWPSGCRSASCTACRKSARPAARS
jgi:ABC-type multidrug transport system fused ATPase/permease subunit